MLWNKLLASILASGPAIFKMRGIPWRLSTAVDATCEPIISWAASSSNPVTSTCAATSKGIGNAATRIARTPGTAHIDVIRLMTSVRPATIRSSIWSNTTTHELFSRRLKTSCSLSVAVPVARASRASTPSAVTTPSRTNRTTSWYPASASVTTVDFPTPVCPYK